MRVAGNGSRPELVIFDLDGTLYPREAYVGQIMEIIARMFVELRGLSAEAAQRELAVLERAMREDWDGTSTTSFVLSHGFTLEQWRDYRARHLCIADGLRPAPDVVRVLARLRQDVRIALLTNNTRDAAAGILDRIGLPSGSFDAVVSAEDVGRTPKPDQGAFRVVLDRLAVAAEQTWAVGDRYDIDVEPLRKLGGSGVTVSGPAELPAAVDHLLAQVSAVG